VPLIKKSTKKVTVFKKDKESRFRKIFFKILIGVIIFPIISWFVLKPIRHFWPDKPSTTVSPSEDTTGVLRPRHPNVSSSQEQVVGGAFDTATGILTITRKNITYQPLGRYVPFFVTRRDNGLSITAIIYSLDGKVAAEIRDNRWKTNDNKFRKTFDGSSLEVVDNYNIPVLQVEYVDPQTARVSGMFRSEKQKAAVLYPHLPVVDYSFTPAMFTVEKDQFIVVGGGAIVSLKVPFNREEFEEVRAAAQKLLEPWFDY
jgi:hypothetical protein